MSLRCGLQCSCGNERANLGASRACLLLYHPDGDLTAVQRSLLYSNSAYISAPEWYVFSSSTLAKCCLQAPRGGSRITVRGSFCFLFCDAEISLRGHLAAARRRGGRGGSFSPSVLTLLEPQSRFGDKPVKFQVVCPQKRDCGSKGVTSFFFDHRSFRPPLSSCLP